MLQITAASYKHLLMKPLKILKVQSWSSPTSPKNTRSDILNVSSQTPVPQLQGDLIEKGIARKFYLSVIIEQHLRIEALLDTGADITLMSTELLKEVKKERRGLLEPSSSKGAN